MHGILDQAPVCQIEEEDSVRGYLVRRARVLIQKATEEEKALLEEALHEVLSRLGVLPGDDAS